METEDGNNHDYSDVEIDHSASLFCSKQSLFEWISTVYEKIHAEDPSDDNNKVIDLKEKVLSVAALAFEVSIENGNEELLEMLQIFSESFEEEYGSEYCSRIVDLCKQYPSVLAQVCLLKAVNKSTNPQLIRYFVEIIRELSDECQQNLMNIINDKLSTYLITEETFFSDFSVLTTADVAITVVESIQNTIQLNNETNSNNNNNNSNSSTAAAAASMRTTAININNSDAFVCQSCREKDDYIKLLKADVSNSVSRETTIDHKLKSELAIAKTKLVEAELEVLERDKYAKHCLNQFEESKTRLREIEEQLQKQKEKCSELEGLKDQIDILRPLAAKAENNELQILRFKEKLEELSDVKQQLKMESEALEEIHLKLLATEQELDLHKKYKLQVEEYRNQLTESTIIIDDLTIRGLKKDELITELKNRIERLENGNICHLEATQQLANELQATNEQLLQSTHTSTNGIGNGLCEINPILMQELQKLRSDNEMLQSKLDSVSLDHLNCLEKTIEDQKSINKSLQSKWMDTSDALKIANNCITNLQSELVTLNLLKIQMKNEFSENSQMFSEDRNSLKIELQKQNLFIRKQSVAQLHMLSVGKTAVISDLSNSLSEMETENSYLSTELATNKENVTQLTENLQNERIEKKRIRESFETELLELQETHKSELETEEEKQKMLNFQIEEEKLKRRKVEREKRIIESDVQRYKTQIQITGTGGNCVEVENALKEMQSMRAQLEESEVEIKSLRTQLRNGCIGVGNVTEPEAIIATSGGVSTRSRRVLADSASATAATSTASATTITTTTSALRTAAMSAGNNAVSGYGFIDQSAFGELVDKRVEQLQKEKREMIARNLEENKERMELNQKLMHSEGTISTLKQALRKITLEKERLERKFQKAEMMTNPHEEAENILNQRH